MSCQLARLLVAVAVAIVTASCTGPPPAPDTAEGAASPAERPRDPDEAVADRSAGASASPAEPGRRPEGPSPALSPSSPAPSPSSPAPSVPSAPSATASPRTAAEEDQSRRRAADVIASADGPVRFAAAWAPARSAGELAERIADAERRARADAGSDRERQEAGFEAQLAYRQLARTPQWSEQVLTAVPAALRDTAVGNVAARVALDALRTEGVERRGPPTALPAWEIVPPAPADELVSHYREAAAEIGVEWEYLAAINLVETRMGRIRGLSTAGARGPMQFIPESWAIFGEGDIDDERDAIFAAARHLRERGWDEGPRAALYRYNNSEHYVDAVDSYARVLQSDPDAYRTHHGWQVLFTTPDETFLLPVGYREDAPVRIEDYLARPGVEVTG